MLNQFHKLLFLLSLVVFLACKDECRDVLCINGGTCVNGECACPDGYTGPACEQEVTPSKIILSEAVVKQFPNVDGVGASWDFGSGPDIYIRIKKGSQVIYTYNVSNRFENAISPGNFVFNLSNLELDDPLARYSIDIMDYDDFSAADYVAGILFYPYVDGNGFPATLNMDTGEAEIQLKLLYRF